MLTGTCIDVSDDENNDEEGEEGEEGEDGTWVFLRLIFGKRVCKRLDLECFLVGFWKEFE